MDYYLDALWPDPEDVQDAGLATWFACYAEDRANYHADLGRKNRAALWDLAHRYSRRAIYLATGREPTR